VRMGCNASKAQDIQATQRRQRTSEPPKPTSTVPQQAPEKIAPPVSQVPRAASYNDKREVENDFFKEIIEKTAQNLIDVSQSSSILDGSGIDVASREKQYSEHISSFMIPQKSKTIFVLPEPSQVNVSLQDTFASPFTPDIQEFLNQAGKAIHSAFQEVKIKDCGPIVVQFPAI